MNNLLLKVNNLTKSFLVNGEKINAVHNVSFSLKEGEVLCVVGPSGSGKSTLLRCLSGLEKIDFGSIVLLGKHEIHEYEKKSLSVLRDTVTFVFQDFSLWPHKTVLENIVMAPIVKGKGRQHTIDKAHQLLKRFDLYDKKDVYPDFLSGGQKQRAAIIRALMMEPKVLLFDEITSALDPEVVKNILTFIKTLAKEGQSMIIVTHELRFAAEVADRIIFLEDGKILQEDVVRDFMYAQKNKRIQEFIKALSLSKHEINIYEGYDQFQSFQIGTLKRFSEGSSKNVVGSSGDRWFEAMGKYYKQYEEERARKNISWRMIMYEESPLDADLRKRLPALNEYRLIPKNYQNPANYYVIDDVVVIQIFGEPGDEPSIIEIKNAHVAKSYQNFFDLLWERGTPIK